MAIFGRRGGGDPRGDEDDENKTSSSKNTRTTTPPPTTTTEAKSTPYKSILKNSPKTSLSSSAGSALGKDPHSTRDAQDESCARKGPPSWKVTRMKLAAVRAFQEQIRKDRVGGSENEGAESAPPGSSRRYNERAVHKLLSEMQVDLKNILSSSSELTTPAASARSLGSCSKESRSPTATLSPLDEEGEQRMREMDGEAAFEKHERQLLDTLQDAETYLDLKERWVGDDDEGARQTRGHKQEGKNAKFKAAVNAVMFVGATKSGVRFSTKTVREFNRESSFWDHEYWDDRDEETLSHHSLSMSSLSMSSGAASILKESWMNEWESRVSMMPEEAVLERACLKLVVMWVETKHLSSKSSKWQRKYGRLSPGDVVYHRVHRYPAVALRKLAELCQRPPTFFLDDEKRREAALVYLYDALAMWENGECQDAEALLRECKEEMARARKDGQGQDSGEGSGQGRDKWDTFVVKLRTSMKKILKPFNLSRTES